MMAWMNAESLTLTVEENRAIYWSRSRQNYGVKAKNQVMCNILKKSGSTAIAMLLY